MLFAFRWQLVKNLADSIDISSQIIEDLTVTPNRFALCNLYMSKLDSKSNEKIYMSSSYGMNAMIKIQKSQGLTSQKNEIPLMIYGIS